MRHLKKNLRDNKFDKTDLTPIRSDKFSYQTNLWAVAASWQMAVDVTDWKCTASIRIVANLSEKSKKSMTISLDGWAYIPDFEH